MGMSEDAPLIRFFFMVIILNDLDFDLIISIVNNHSRITHLSR
jgi:hypothetical protein